MNYKDQLSDIAETVHKHCSDFDLIYTKGSSLSITTQEQRVDQYKVASSQVLGLRVCQNNRVGLSYTETLDPEAIKACIGQALENAKSTSENPYEKISINSEKDLIEDNEQIFVPEEIPSDSKIANTLEMEQMSRKADAKITGVPYNGYSEAVSEYHYLNSLGTFCRSREKYYSCYSSALFKEDNKNSMHYHSAIARKFSDLNWQDCTQMSVLHGRAWLDATPIATGRYHVLFTQDSLQSLLGCFGHIFSAKSASEQTNPWRDKLGSKVASTVLSISDCPRYPETFSPDLFDSEGMVMEDLELIKNGELVNFYHNTATANFFKTTSNARASRSAKGALAVGGSTKVISAGSASHKDFSAQKYLEVHTMQGLHSGANAFSGDFSFAASGYLYDKGEKIQGVKGITVAGNIFEVLKNIVIVGQDIKPNDSYNFFAPDILFGELSIAGI